MVEHYLGLEGAATLGTPDLLITEQAVLDIVERNAMGAIYGAAGLGKSFAIAWAIRNRQSPPMMLKFETRPTMRLVADRMLHDLRGTPGRGTRFAMTEELMRLLAEQPRLVIIGEAQNLNRDCFEFLRHLHDDRSTTFSLLFDGGHGCWSVLSREPMLRSRIYRAVEFAPLSVEKVLEMIPSYHPIYADVDPNLIRLIDDRFANGNLRAWAMFTLTAQKICQRNSTRCISKNIARSAITQIGG